MSRSGETRASLRAYIRDTSGVLALEACVTVLAFLVLALVFMSFFPMFMAQNATAHALLQTTQSLALDTYAADKLGSSSETGMASVKELNLKVFGSLVNGEGLFSSNEVILKNKGSEDGATPEGKKAVRERAVAAAEKRFVAYLAGGDEQEADRLLKMMFVENGITGLSFSDTHVEGDLLYVTVKYTFKNDFNVWAKPIEVEQTACARMWS